MNDVQARINQNLQLCEDIYSVKDSDHRRALRYLFSVLSHLEHIAVIAGRRGNGVKGQYEDELVHEGTFKALAEGFGGFLAPSVPVRNLVSYVSVLDGDEFLAILNVVSEAWLSTLFDHIGTWHIADKLFDAIGQEEARHVYEARIGISLNMMRSQKLVQELETRLFNVSNDPEFLWPLCFLGSPNKVARMGKDMTKAHKEAVRFLGCIPGNYIHEITRCSRDVRTDIEPDPYELNPSQQLHFDTGAQPIWCSLDVEIGSLPESKLELAVSMALSEALCSTPRLNLVVHPGRPQVFQAQTPIIGHRRLWDKEELVSTVYLRSPHRISLDRFATRMKSLVRRLRGVPYQGSPGILADDLWRLAPTPRCAAVVTNCQWQFPEGTRGMLSLNPREGATIGVVISPKVANGTHNLGIIVDHRVHNGRELGWLAQSIKSYLYTERWR